jgi:hypothetical protein
METEDLICPLCGEVAGEHGCDVCGLTYTEITERKEE